LGRIKFAPGRPGDPTLACRRAAGPILALASAAPSSIMNGQAQQLAPPGQP